MMQLQTQLKPAVLALLFAIPATLPSIVQAQDREPVDEIVALVEDDVILRSELESTIQNITRQVQARGERLPPRNVMEEQVLERLIMTRLEVLRAQATGIRVSDQEVDRALNDVASQNNMSLARMRSMIEADGYDFSEFREDIRNEILTSRLRDRIVSSMDEITETEVDILLASDRLGGDEYHLSQILIALPEAASPQEVREAEARAEEIRNELEAGMEFASAAISYSQGPNALEGGEVGWRNVNTLPRGLATEIENLQAGEVSEPLRAGGGLLLVRVNDRRARGDVIVREFSARHLMIEDSELVSPQQARERIQDLHRQLREGADFGELAREWSDDESSANLGGRLNWFPEGSYGPQIQQVLDELEPGELSEPFQTPGAWHILRLEDVREADRTRESRRAEAREMLSRQKADEEIERFLRTLRGEAFVEVRL